mmetsp:Transcript_81/g.237  ORF Transcript_81/g.237 Transcript_81/m.237 type:complete len:461 (+) Transcript_81:41-1423(+)
MAKPIVSSVRSQLTFEPVDASCPVQGTVMDQIGQGSFGLHLLQNSAEFAALCAEHHVQTVPSASKVPDVLREWVAAGAEDAFYVCDLSVVLRKLHEWQLYLPRVRPHYAVKCNPDPFIVRALALAGAGFDCASKSEISLALSCGVPSEDIIFANPCKQNSTVRFAHQKGVKQMTFDNPVELAKIKSISPDAELVLRLAVDDSQSLCRFNSKFGVRPEDCEELLAAAKELDLDVAGVSFHVGSGCSSVTSFRDAVVSAKTVFDQATALGFKMRLLDLGGGFPGSDSGTLTFESIALALSGALEEHFPAASGVRIIAEPGRYFVSESHTLATCIISKRQLPADEEAGPMLCADAAQEPEVAYYLNDGVYGSFNCVVFDHAEVVPRLLSPSANATERPSKLFGPTCDSVDVLMASVPLLEAEVGDWLYFTNMGAYTRSAASQFNGFEVPPCKYVMSVDGLSGS